MKRVLVSTAVAGFAMMLSGNANADIVIDLSGMETDGDAPVVLDVAGEDGTVVTGINFDFGYTPIAPSWTSELEITVANGSGSVFGGSAEGGGGPYDIEFGGVNNSDPFTFAGSSDGLDGTSGAGVWTITLAENFNDAGVDATFDDGSTITIKTDLIPAPGAFALLGIAGLATRRRRR